MQATAVATTLFSMSLTSCGSADKQQGTDQQQAPAIGVAKVAFGSTTLNNSYPATIKGKNDIEIRPQVSGFITKVHVDEGQPVRKGQLLFTIDQVQFQAAVNQAEAAVNSARSALSSAQLTADSKQRLFERNIISQYENELAQNSLSQARSQLATAEAALVQARKNLSYTTVTAPADGVVGSIPNREGTLASPSMVQPLTTVSDNRDVYAYFSLNEKDILALTDNGSKTLAQSIASMPEVELTLADGSVYPTRGRVATVSGVLDPTTGTATVRALFPNASGVLRSGSTGRVNIPVLRDSVVIIPQRATFEIQDRRFVFVVNDSNKVVATPVMVAPESDGQTFVVNSGLTPGQRIAIEGVGSTLRDGMTIQPVDPATTPAQPVK